MKLKTYITNLGFFELAIAAPSMKAALEAWGMSHNAFQHGLAKQTDDPAIVATTTARPGVVLKRAVGTSGAFKEDAELPDALPNIRPPARTSATIKTSIKAPAKRKESPKPERSRAAILSFEKARRAREKARAKEEAKLAKQRSERQRATDKAEAALEEARQAHERAIAAIEQEQEKLNRKSEKENTRWEAQRKNLAQAVERARD